MPLLSSSSRIQRVRAVMGDRDPTAARRRLERALRSVDLEPAGLPAGALLCVRRWRDPLPGRLAAAERETDDNVRWSQAARASLDRVASGAVRPRAGRLPAGAEAVFFPDESDLLACFALSQAEGRVAFEWWWTCALPAADLRCPWTELWGRNPTLIPAALRLLAAESALRSVLRSLPASAAGPLNRQLAITYGLPELLRVLARSATPLLPAISLTGSTSSPFDGRAPGPGVVSVREVDPAGYPAEISPEEMTAITALPGETGVFALLGLLLARNPARVRQAAFVPFVRRVLDGGLTPLRRDAPAAAIPSEVPPDAEPTAATPPPASASRNLARAPASSAPFAPRAESDSRPTPEAPAPGAAAPAAAAPRPPAVPPPRRELPRPGPEMVVATAHGGIFYLLNLALALGLYGDFTQPLRPGLALSPWDFLVRLGRQLLRDQPGVENDPLWGALAQLAGFAGEQPDASAGLADWQPEAAWSDRPVSVPAEARISFAGFLAWLLPVLSDRLELAGLTFPVLLSQPARLVVTAGRVEVHFSLSAHPIEIRLAGLDRDPGWIPAAGRDVRFHYD